VPTAPPAWLVQPTDPRIPGKPLAYSGVTSGVKRFGVVEPKDWRELNRSVGPQGQGGGMSGMDMGNKRDTGGR
jgi:hypothetical protein